MIIRELAHWKEQRVTQESTKQGKYPALSRKLVPLRRTLPRALATYKGRLHHYLVRNMCCFFPLVVQDPTLNLSLLGER